MPCVHWENSTREQITACAPTAVAVLPVGSTEQHAAHLPTKTDIFIAGAVARSACERLPSDVTAVLLPPVAFGSSPHHIPFGGTLSLRQETLNALLMDLLESVVQAGFDRALLLNGHGGNVEICGAVAKRAAIELDMLAAAVSYWQFLPQEKHIPGHAGVFETSIMLALAADAVDLSAAAPSGGSLGSLPHGGVVEDLRQWGGMGGWTDDPTSASAELGSQYFERVASASAETISALASWQRAKRNG